MEPILHCWSCQGGPPYGLVGRWRFNREPDGQIRSDVSDAIRREGGPFYVATTEDAVYSVHGDD